MSTPSVASFIGLADHVEYRGLAFPYGPADFFGVSVLKRFTVYPWSLKDFVWFFLVHNSILRAPGEPPLEITIASDLGAILGTIKIAPTGIIEGPRMIPPAEDVAPGTQFAAPAYLDWHLVMVRMDCVVPAPGKYVVSSQYQSERQTIGELHFAYTRSDPLTLDRIRAAESNPTSLKSVLFEISCKECGDQFKTYAGLKRDSKQESKGYQWQYDLADSYTCRCSKTRYSLALLRESMHGLLGNDTISSRGTPAYTRMYSHENVKRVVEKYDALLREEPDEESVQKFIEANPLMLAQLQARRFFVKPTVLGKFAADFAVLNVRGELVFVELEPPSMLLFKRDGHPTAKLMHAYGQVRDWLHEYSKHSLAILESLNLKPHEVMAVKGVVIGGRSGSAEPSHMQRHLMARPYPDIEFFTLDDLAFSVIQLSKELS